jgi:HAE1 family hydrophobic/amphiphilic exporter-1
VFTRFFIERPVFASVLALLIVLLGAISIPALPVAQYPELSAPQVTVRSVYVGASAQVVEAAVTTPLERQINGAEGMRYLTSTSGSDGVSVITATFDVGRDKDLAAVDVQNRVNTALPTLPAEVRAVGVVVAKTTPAIILAAGFYSEDNSLSDVFISNYVDVNVVDAIKRIPGVANVTIFGERRYAMRLWLDPDRLAARGLTATDVLAALREQNALIAAGQVGQAPAPPGQTFQISVRAMGRLSDPREFERLVLKRGQDGSLVLLSDVGRAELGAEDYSTRLRFNGREAVGFGVFQLPGANLLELDKAVQAELARLSRDFPPSVKYLVAFNPTIAVRESIRDVLVTLAEAIVLVMLVIFVFLQDWRSTLIPAITIPVSLVGTFLFVNAFGFSINTLTLFGIVLATGLVVDDAIVVVENIARNLEGGADTPRTATERAMAEVGGAVVAMSLVLVAVFVPVAFLPGTTGRLYTQFALTIAFSIAISTLNALTLSPALAGLLMRPPAEAERRFVLFRWFNRGFARTENGYQRSLRRVLRRQRWPALAFVGALALTALVFRSVPTGFVPDEDQNYFIIQMQGPQGASIEYMTDIAKQIEARLQTRPEVQNIFAVMGFSFGGSGPNRGVVFASLSPVGERKAKQHSVMAVLEDMRGKLLAIPGAIVVPLLPPPIQGQGAFGGFTLELIDRTVGRDFGPLAQGTAQMIAQAPRTGKVAGMFTSFSVEDPQLVLRIDREKAKAIAVPFDAINDALGVYMGSRYVNDFDFNNRSYRVYAQAAPQFRDQPADLGRFYVRTGAGQLTPLGSLIDVKPTVAPPVISHYNLFRSVELLGGPPPGVSSGEAIAALEQTARQVLPANVSYDWSGLSWEEVRAGGRSMLIFALGLVLVFLVLAALYESYALPFVIILAVPLALLGALLAQRLRGQVNDVFAQVGLLMLIGLASKNAILIVEFAEQLRKRGASAVDAAIEAAHLRLRPILMTSFAFLLGVIPLVIATGAGANGRRSLGTAVFGGLLLSTILNLYFTPALYVMMRGAIDRLHRRRRSPQPPAPAPAPAS